jgi:hypothetical protein
LGGARDYALEGSIFSAGAPVQWLRDGLGIIANAAEAGVLAAASDLEQEVYLVPAFTGLGAPHWRADVRCSVMGLTLRSYFRERASDFQVLDAITTFEDKRCMEHCNLTFCTKTLAYARLMAMSVLQLEFVNFDQYFCNSSDQ